MNDNQSYEHLIKKKNEGSLLLSKIALIAAYILVALIGLLLVIFLAKGNAALIMLVLALDLCFYLLTWKLVNVEYEYTFVGDTFYLSKILGKSARKELFECEMSRAVTVAPYRDDYRAEAERQHPDKIFSAISSKNAEDVWFMLFENEGSVKTMVLFEADEKSLRCLRKGSPRAVAREKLTQIQKTMEESSDA